MLKTVYMLFLAVILVGCSMANNELETLPKEAAPVPARAVTPATDVEETPLMAETINNPAPRYIEESKYEGDELGIVKTLNSIVKSFYEKDIDAYNSLITGDINPIEDGSGFKKHFISIDKLDFTVKPDPAPPKDVKPVVLEYTEKNYGYEEIEKEKQLFSFRFEGKTWKLVSIADWW